MLKVIMFSYLFWFVLTIIFITGTTRISVFCMGYLVACFYFLLFGGELLLKPIKSILHYWDFLIAYNVFVITMKNILSVSKPDSCRKEGGVVISIRKRYSIAWIDRISAVEWASMLKGLQSFFSSASRLPVVWRSGKTFWWQTNKATSHMPLFSQSTLLYFSSKEK